MRGKILNTRIKLGYLKALPSGFSKIGKNNIYTNDYVGGSINNQHFYSDNFVRTGLMNNTSVNADYEHAILWHLQGVDIFKIINGKVAEKLSYVKG